MATSFDLTGDNAIIQGDTFRWVISIVDTANAVIDLTTFTIRGCVRKSYADVAVLTTTATADGVLFVCTKSDQVASKGEVVVTITSANTALLPKGSYKYDIEMSDGGPVEEVHKLYRGIAQVLPEATK